MTATRKEAIKQGWGVYLGRLPGGSEADLEPKLNILINKGLRGPWASEHFLGSTSTSPLLRRKDLSLRFDRHSFVPPFPVINYLT